MTCSIYWRMTTLNFTCGFSTDAKFVDILTNDYSKLHLWFLYGCEIRRLLRLNTKRFRNIYVQPEIKWQNWSNITVQQKKNPGKNREFFHDFSSFCKNMSRQLSLWSLFFALFFLQGCVTFMTWKQSRIIFGLNYEDLYKLLCSSKMVIMHNRYFREWALPSFLC